MQQRISKEKRALILALLAEGNTINGTCRMLKVGKPNLLRFLKEAGEACEAWHDKHFRGFEIARLELDEQWAYVHTHKERMSAAERASNQRKGDSWLWAGIDPDSKAIIAWRTGKRGQREANQFAYDLAERIEGRVQIATDKLAAYQNAIAMAFGIHGADYGTEHKEFANKREQIGFHEEEKLGVNRLTGTKREAVFGNPDLNTTTTSHIERFFLTRRQSDKRCARKTLAYSKDWDNHALCTSLHIFIYNMVRKHETLKTAPAVKLGIIAKPWTLEMVVAMIDKYLREKEESEFEAAFAAMESSRFATEPRKAPKTYAPVAPLTPWYLDPQSGGPNPAVKKPGIKYEDN